MRVLLLVFLLCAITLALANPQRGRPGGRDRGRGDRPGRRRPGKGRGPPNNTHHKCLKGLIRECDWKDFCDDTDARKPLIVEKSLIESEACPRTGSNMEDVEIEEVERSRGDKCDDCPYCSERGVSFSDFFTKKNNSANRDGSGLDLKRSIVSLGKVLIDFHF